MLTRRAGAGWRSPPGEGASSRAVSSSRGAALAGHSIGASATGTRLIGFLALLLGTAFATGCATPGARTVRSERLPAVELAAGVYVVHGAAGEIGPDNEGRIGNAGFIVGESGVVAIDAGVSYRHGVALLEAVAAVTDKPVRLVLVTHARQEFLFGVAAYRERGIPVRMHRRAARLMAARCEDCLIRLRRVLGEEAMRGTAMFTPDQQFDDAHSLDLVGRPIDVLHFGHASGPGDVAVLDRQSGVLFAGGLLDQRRVPDVQDADFAGWKRSLHALRELPLTRIVPGHGPASSPALVATVERYLTQLENRTLELFRAGVALSEVPDAAALPEFGDWDQYATTHRRNAAIVYLRHEREQLFKDQE